MRRRPLRSGRRFTNEIGNPIRVGVEGPTSIFENTLTRNEAEVLLDCLLRVLRPEA